MTNKTQSFGLFICSQSALRVSVDVFAHHQEFLTIFTASDIVHLCCCQNGTEFHLVHYTGRQQRRWTISEPVNRVKCSWWWAKTSSETCRTDWVQINKPRDASCWSSSTNYTNDGRTYKLQKNNLMPQSSWVERKWKL